MLNKMGKKIKQFNFELEVSIKNLFGILFSTKNKSLKFHKIRKILRKKLLNSNN